MQNFQALGVLPPDLQLLLVTGGSAPIPLVANFWPCTWLVVGTRNVNALHQNFLSITSTKKVGA